MNMGTHGSSICIALYILPSERRLHLLLTFPMPASTKTSLSDGPFALCKCSPGLPWPFCMKPKCKVSPLRYYPCIYDCFTMDGTPAVGVSNPPGLARSATHMRTSWSRSPLAQSLLSFSLILSCLLIPGFSQPLSFTSHGHFIVSMRYTLYIISSATGTPGPRIPFAH